MIILVYEGEENAMGKYMPLTQWLLKCSADSIKLSFSKLEEILGFELPDSAYVHDRWWMNDVYHSQAQSWLDAGYKTVNSREPIINQTIEFYKGSNKKYLVDNENVYVKPQVPRIGKTVAQNDLSIVKVSQKKTITLDKYIFTKTPFKFYEKDITSPFLQYDGHTVNSLLNKRRYASLRFTVENQYPQFLNSRIQSFMKYLVQNKDDFYLKFLNKNGNDTFCRFGLTDKDVFQKKGLYLYEYDGNIMYIGRCRDNYFTRFNINYGTIQPINCYKEGQSTNTHMNSLMNKYGDDISIYLCPLTNINEIIAAEEMLIKRLQPSWNRKK